MAGVPEPEIVVNSLNGNIPSTDAIESQQSIAQVPAEDKPNLSDCEPPKRRKTRRGKAKRRNHPYQKTGSVCKPEAPYNSNRFLIEDHGDVKDIDEELKKTDQVSTSTVTRTRDSSFSMDGSDGEFYSTPDYEDEFLIKDFDTQYESLQAERLQSMSKDELIQEFLLFERKVEGLTNRLRKIQCVKSDTCQSEHCRKEIQRLTLENDILRQENESMKASINLNTDSDSADSETDSDSSGSESSSTSSLSRPPTPSSDNKIITTFC